MKNRRSNEEHQIQAEFISLIRYYEYDYPFLELLYAVPNGAKRTRFEAQQLKAEGLRSGVCDCAFPYPNGVYGSLYLEFKKSKGGVVSKAQKDYIALLRKANNRAEVVRSAEEALKIVAEHTGYDLPYFDIKKGY